MTHDDIVKALTVAYPESEWSYDGDGSSLDPVHDEETGELVSRGLEWHDPKRKRPTLAKLKKVKV
jgi:hypothetical protein